MPTESSERFADNWFTDNWAYLKTELRWLDQVLMLAVARQRKETQEIERVTHSKADRVTSSWWKGILATDGKAAYDEYRQPAAATTKTPYQQQLESKVQTSRSQGICLALPSLRDRLGLTLFEKNLVLMSLAPEVNRRYARLYRYLQGDEPTVKTDWPTLDLVLRLMCRNDVEWRDARHRLVSNSPLVQQQLLQFLPHSTDSLLNCPLKLTAPLVNYLLSAQPTEADLNTLLPPLPDPTPVPTVVSLPLPPSRALSRSSLLKQTTTAVAWSDLVLPAPLLAALQALPQRIQAQVEAEARWSFNPNDSVLSSSATLPSGTIALLAGTTGTGKTLAAAAIAHSLNTPLESLDLALVDPQDYAQALQEIMVQNPIALLLKSAQLWFGRSAGLSSASLGLPASSLRQFWAQRQQVPGVTLLSVGHPSKIQFEWRQKANILLFPMPSASDRLRLWQMAFPAKVPLSPNIDWKALSSLPLTGGEIVAIAHEAVLSAAATAAEQIEPLHLSQVLSQSGRNFKGASAIAPPQSRQKKLRKKKNGKQTK